MRITIDEVRTTAAMARLALSQEELAQLTGELDQILGYAAKLQEIDVTGVEPTTHAVPLHCPLREDQVGPQLSVDEALRDAPARDGAFFTVPAIIEKDEE